MIKTERQREMIRGGKEKEEGVIKTGRQREI